MTMPINTNTTIAACIQIQVGDMLGVAGYANGRQSGGTGHGLLSVGAMKEGQEREQHDLHVQAERPVGDVVVVRFDALVQ